jgi:hypothetical protein
MCKKRMSVRIPEGVSIKDGDKIFCPKACGGYMRSCHDGQFDPVKIERYEDTDLSGITYCDYKEEELRSKWHLEDSSSAGISDERQNGAKPPLETDANTKRVRETDTLPDSEKSKASTDAKSTASKYNNGISAANVKSENNSGISAADTKSRSGAADTLSPSRQYSQFDLAGRIFSDAAGFPSLKTALEEIFLTWNTDVVFNDKNAANALKDEFIWLLSKTGKYATQDFTKILSDTGLNPQRKFHRLFHAVIFVKSNNERMRKGFYWSDDLAPVHPLTPKFENANDFTEKYCGDESFRNFFKEHKDEILSFLGHKDEAALFENMTPALAKSKNEIVWFDGSKDYLPIRLGSTSDFIENMKKPTPFENMENMISFLEKYKVMQGGAVVKRDSYSPFKRVSCEIQCDCIYNVLGLKASSKYATEYNYFATILKEYIDVFSPDRVEAGGLVFTKLNCSAEIKKIVGDFCAARFGQADADSFRKIEGRAWLTKSIYKAEIFSSFGLENESHINELIELISESESGIDKYYGLFDNPTFIFGSKEVNVSQYIKEIIEKDDVRAICVKFEDDAKIKAFFSKKQPPNPASDQAADLDSLFGKYQKLYDKILKKKE